jgi:hypothetical protein
MEIEVSNGEIIDKLTIIEIKLRKIKDEAKLANLKKEHEVLKSASLDIISDKDPLYRALYKVNSDLWNIEDHIRDLERRGDFGEEFISVARSVYFKNDERAALKRKINMITSSGLIEEKSYEKY